MSIYVGGNQVTDIRIGSTEINSVWIGASKVWERATVTVSGQQIEDFESQEGDSASAGVKFGVDGKVYERVGGNETQIDSSTDWIRPTSAAGSNYEAKATATAGSDSLSSSSDSLDSWLGLGSNRYWGLNATSVEYKSAVITIQIRRSGESSALDSGVYMIIAEGGSSGY